MTEHHPNCAVTRQGDIRSWCDCKWPEIRDEERDKIKKLLIDHANAWHDLSKFSDKSSMAGKTAIARHTAIQDLINLISINYHRANQNEDN